ncbi:MAG: [Fe-Fe] hydrogenase large subunit C-terminal domain-containing protein [Sphaerochaetaceae bacterium]
MKTFEELYYEVLVRTLKEKNAGFLDQLGQYDTHHLDCLLHPEKHPLVWQIGPCSCEEENPVCAQVCPFHAIHRGEAGNMVIDEDKCAGCSLCIDECRARKLTSSKDIIPAIEAIRSHKGLTYALVAPAFLGQFSKEVTPGKLRTALKQIGFDGMIEVSLFADILTMKEALEFDENIKTEKDYQLTSCCCPVWIALIRNIFNELVPHVPPSVSPMIASGRAVKFLHPDALTVFIGPCIAKKAEAKEKDIADAVDYVLTFREVQDVFDVMKINPSEMEDSEKDHSSRAGRIYAHAGGVSEAVSDTLKRLDPDKDIAIRTQAASGVRDCRTMINDLREGKTTANFFEGMGCIGGCVGGPRAIIPKEEGKLNVEAYGAAAPYLTPIDNPYVIELLNRLGLKTVEDLLKKSDIFTRSFD